MNKFYRSLFIFLMLALVPGFVLAGEEASVKSFSEISGLDLDNPLPNWVDTSREKAKDARAIKGVPSAVTPAGFRIPAEYEPVAAVVLGWAGYSQMLSGIARAASSAGAQVWAIGGPSSISGVGNYYQIPLRIDTVWVRDYGPFGISSGNTPGIVDAIYRHYQYRVNDDNIPQKLGQSKGINVYGMNIILDGGNLMVDSYGNLFMTNRTYLWNSHMSKEQVDNALKTALRVKNIIVFDYAGYPNEPEDGTGHIDMFMKLLNDHTVLIAKTEDEPYKSNNNKAIKYFQGRTAPDGQPYKVLTSKGWVSGGAWYTFTNSLIVNNTVVMPSYRGRQAEEKEAIAAYQAGMPGVNVVPVNSDNSIVAGGSIHCVTQTIPVLPRNGKAVDNGASAEINVEEVDFVPSSEKTEMPDTPIVRFLKKLAGN